MSEHCQYFAYGSNMSLNRIRMRTAGAIKQKGYAVLHRHQLRFHKIGKDGSAKCDAFHTNIQRDTMFGVIFQLPMSEKAHLDSTEGVGNGYELKTVTVHCDDGSSTEAFTYFATRIDEQIRPFSWYKHHVIVGARESKLPEAYIAAIERVAAISDHDAQREALERSVHT